MAQKPRSILGTLRKHLANSPQPLLLVNADRLVEYCNEACCQWLGVSEEQLVGQLAPYHFESQRRGASHPAAPLGPPPETLAGLPARRRVVPQQSPSAARWASFLPLRDADGAAGVLVVVDAQEAPESDESASDNGTAAPEAAGLHAELAQFRRRLAGYYQLHALIGHDPAIDRVRAQIAAAAASTTRVLIVGPLGSGREHVARTIYYHQSLQQPAALVPLSCALLDAELLQTTITAFIHSQPELEVTGPVTLLLLDADELNADAQRAVMGVLSILELKAHTLATARRPLLELAREGTYRPDLANFLSTMVVELPALRDRRADIPLLAQKFVELCNSEGPRQLSGLHEEAMDRLVQHDWPRNLDELQQVVRESHRRAAGPWILKSDLPRSFEVIEQALKHPARPLAPIELDEVLAQFEREILQRALEASRGNRARAAQLVGLSRQRFVRRLAQLQIETDQEPQPNPQSTPNPNPIPNPIPKPDFEPDEDDQP